MLTRTLLAAAVALTLPLIAARGGGRVPERMILTGTPPWGPSWIAADGSPVPAGCGPEAARILLAYYDRRSGYRFVADDPAGAIRELRRRMGTVTVVWGGVPQGLTWPWAFAPGLEGYIAARYPGGARIGTFSGSPAAAFERSVGLLRQGVPHVILFDWQGAGGVFPNHYAVVVGYDLAAGRNHLVLNPGWGYDFQILDLADPAVAPVTLFWIEEIRDPPDGRPGTGLAPSAAGMWEVDPQGRVALRPVLRLHFDPGSTVRWPPSSRVEVLVPRADDLAVAIWDPGDP